MDLRNRAKIFAPFSALRGFDIAVLTKEKEKTLMTRAELSDDRKDVLERKLNRLSIGDAVTVTYFSLQKKIGDLEVGCYITERACVEGIDLLNQALVLPHTFVPFVDIYDLQGEGFDYADE